MIDEPGWSSAFRLYLVRQHVNLGETAGKREAMVEVVSSARTLPRGGHAST